MASFSQAKTGKKNKGVFLRDAVSGLIGVYLLLLSPDTLCAVGFVWTANTDHTTEYHVFTRQVGGPSWGDIAPVVVPGVASTTVEVALEPGMYEATITAYSDSYYGTPIAPQESGCAPVISFFVEPETCMEVQGFRVME